MENSLTASGWKDDFYRKYRLSTVPEHLLIIGSFLIEANYKSDSSTLRSRLDPKKIEGILNQAWCVVGAKNAKQLIESLLTLPSVHNFKDVAEVVLNQHKSHPKHPVASALLGESAKLFHFIDQKCETRFFDCGYTFNFSAYQNIKNVASWDIERAGLIIRYAFTIGWLTEEEAIAYLKKAYTVAELNYSNWCQYFIGYLKGRALLFDASEGESSNYITVLNEIMQQPEMYFHHYPLTQSN
ncbi:DUF1266 domain-containing protein [Flavobacterium sp. JP2137]|uniref:DUF1266 domain-containing protein n=1 Tax=Flavobacterium sp. JP2137 TaxID=3414510 RepID=UPI003D2FC708